MLFSAISIPFLSTAFEILMVGAVLCSTVIVNDFSAVLPAVSVAVHVTIVSPIGNISPDYGLVSIFHRITIMGL